MAEIKTIVSEDVTMQKVIGIPTGYELMTCLKEFYAGNPTKIVVWDLSACSLEQVTADDLRQIVSFVRSYAHTRLEDKTAIVAPSDANHLQDELNKSQSHNDLHLLTLIKELDDCKYRMDRLCDAIENGILPIEVAQERSRKIQSRRQDALAEMAGLRNQQEFPLKDFGPKRINYFCNALRTKLSDKESNFGKDYIKLLVEEIRIAGKDVRMRGKYTDVVTVMQRTALEYPVGLPRAGSVWLPKPDGAGQWIEYLSVQKPVRCR